MGVWPDVQDRPAVHDVSFPLYGCLWSMWRVLGFHRRRAVSSGEIDIRIGNRGLSHLQYYNGAGPSGAVRAAELRRDLTVEAVPKPRLVATKKRAGGRRKVDAGVSPLGAG